MTSTIALIGGGNMGYALAAGLLARSPGSNIIIAEPDPAQRQRFGDLAVATTADNADAAKQAETVVLAVKPQAIGAAVRSIADVVSGLVISIAAGVPLTALSAWLGPVPIVRCMPNTPALLGMGITGLAANEHVSAAQRSQAHELLGAVGEVVWFDDEGDLDTVTALSGSGPAYFFAVIEALTEAGAELGLNRDTALQLAVHTARGAAEMVLAGEDPGELRRRVTSKGGTTERALSILEAADFDAVLRAAVKGARDRSRELNEEFGNG